MTVESRDAIEAVWRIEAPRLIGGLVRMVGDLDRAEDLAQDALVSALESWTDAIPDNPGAWLMRTAKNRAIDELRRDAMRGRKHERIAAERPPRDTAAEMADAVDDDVGDDLLRLVLIACSPVLAPDARVALTLRLVAGLEVDEIARAFLAKPATIYQRISRAKRTLEEARASFEVPRGDELERRLESVFEVVYLVFNEGYAATSSEDWVRPRLCATAVRLGRVLCGLVPDNAEAHGLCALMELHASRLRTRVGRDGRPVLLADQDRRRWDYFLIERGLTALKSAESLPGPHGPYALQGAIAACHARARSFEATDWERIAALYDALAAITHSTVVELNRAVAVGMAFGPDEGLDLLDQLAATGALDDYYLLPAARGELLARSGRHDEAREQFLRAAEGATNPREAATLRDRAASLDVRRMV